MKHYILFVMCATLMLVCSCSQNEKDYDATGVFEATEVTVSAESAGTLQHFILAEGTFLRGDSLVGSIDDTHLQLQKQQLSTNYEQLNASADQLSSSTDQLSANHQQLAANKAATESRILDLEKQLASTAQQIANLQGEQQRFSELVRDGAVARKQLDDINYQIRILEKQLVATREQLQSANRSLAQQAAAIDAQMQGVDAQREGVMAQRRGVAAQRHRLDVQQGQIDNQLSHTRIKAPFSGMVLEKYVEQGEFVNVGKPLFKIADMENMFLRAYITSSQLQKVKVGQSVKVYASYGNGQRKEYQGHISWIAQKAEFTPKSIVTDDERANLVYAVKIAVKNDGFLKIGMYGEVKL